jgi:hypothetical protein
MNRKGKCECKLNDNGKYNEYETRVTEMEMRRIK